MTRFPLFQSPALDAAELAMRPTADFRHGYLGNDPRKLVEILQADLARVKALGLTHEDLAGRLARITVEATSTGMGNAVVVDGAWEVSVTAARGVLPCPFGHPGVFPKTEVRARNLKTGKEIIWTDLSVHMIHAHGFYQGQGSPYRLDPGELAVFLGLAPG
ncbi:MAG: hypothetical protein KKA60_04520 [Proteobacteria bacterium]|nr:hypothetical protein [Pseudomonadota bacterium]